MSESERNWKILVEEDNVTPKIEEAVASCVEWFDDEPRMGTEEFIDRLCKTYGGGGYDPDDFDVHNFDTPAVRKIMRIARRIRKETQT